ncbi:MAG: MBL fold metallo-hydrolase [Candidatus Krumholzibacteriia bacterium]
MRVDMLTVGVFQSNCFIASCVETGEAIIVDAGDEAERILEAVKGLGVDVKMVINTHAHIDHVTALPDVVAALQVPVVMHKDEIPIYEILPQQASFFGLTAPKLVAIDRYVAEGDAVSFGRVTGRVIETPGHSPGGISLVFAGDKPPRVFVGDVLFQGSIGRTDLLGADHAQMMRTLENVIMKLPDDMVVHSGHGPETTIGAEKETNPFLLQLG